MRVLNMPRLAAAGCAGVLAGALALTPAHAASEAMMDLLKVLRDNGTISAEAYEQLRMAVLADGEKDEAATRKTVTEAVDKAAGGLPEISTKGKLEVKSRDGDFKWRLGGRIMADAALYDNDGASELSSGAELRRARLYMSGTLWRVWDFKLQEDFGDGGAATKDAYIRYTGFGPTRITVGHFKEPFSLEELTSSKYITFMERALPNAFAPGRRLGVGVDTHGGDWTAAFGVFSSGGLGHTGTDADGIDVAGRVTYSPIHDETRAVHLGAAVAWRNPTQNDALRLRERPESHLTSTRLVDTGTLLIDDYLQYGFEGAVVWGPWSLQGEYIAADLGQDMPGAPDLDLDGWYVYGSWFLTGESRHYKAKSGAFGGIKPKGVVGKGGIGAWELGLRFSSLDLTDEPLTGGVAGGEEDNLTVGLNWYPNANLRFMANWVQVLDLERAGNALDGAEPGVFQLRAQAHW